MLHSYFEFRKEQDEVLNSIIYYLNTAEYNTTSSDEYSSLKKKISNLNEYQFFSTLCDLMFEYPVEYLNNEIIECFFEASLRIDNENDEPLPFQDDCDEYEYLPTFDLYISLNCKSVIEQLVVDHFNAKNYLPKILINNLFVLQDEILEKLYQKIFTIKHYFKYYTGNDDSNDNGKIVNSIYIIKALEDLEINILGLTENIQERINNLSKTTLPVENYLITTSEDILKKLYYGLEKEMFINQSKTSLEQFIKVLKLDWKEHNDVIDLEMDNIQFKFFIDSLKEYLNIKIAITILEKAGNIINKNGVIKAKSVYVSIAKTRMLAKNADKIKSIFDKLQKG